MKNKINSFMLGLITGAIIFGSMGVVAITLSANQVTYTPSDSSFAVSNTKDAIDELYKMARSNNSITKVLVGSGELKSTKEFDISAYEGCEYFALENFAVEVTSAKVVEAAGATTEKGNSYDASLVLYQLVLIIVQILLIVGILGHMFHMTSTYTIKI